MYKCVPFNGPSGYVAGRPLLSLVLLSLILVCLASAPAVAQTGMSSTDTASVMDRIRAKMREAGNRDQVRQWFNVLDTDRNGEITKQELFSGLRKRFEALDRNRDGFVSKSEYMTARHDGQMGEARFGKLDTNADGRLDMTEFASPADWRFDRIDRNLDGVISRSEADRLFDRDAKLDASSPIGECFYVDRQIVRVDKETAELYRSRGYPAADCVWTPDQSEKVKVRARLDD